MPAAFKDAAVQAVFDQYEADVRDKLLSLRELIFDQAALIPSVGPLSESLKWGQLPIAPLQTGLARRCDWMLSPVRAGLWHFMFPAQPP